MLISLLVSISENNVIGKDNKIPWHISSDLKRFKRLTMGHHIIMGRKTYESIGKPLPGRTMIVLSKEQHSNQSSIIWAHSLQNALEIAKKAGDDEAFIIGGAAIFKLAMPMAHKLYLTRVHAIVAGDTFFPQFDSSKWLLVNKATYPSSEQDEYPFTYLDYRKISLPI